MRIMANAALPSTRIIRGNRMSCLVCFVTVILVSSVGSKGKLVQTLAASQTTFKPAGPYAEPFISMSFADC